MLDAVEKVGVKKDKLFNFRPAFFAAIFLVLGILFGYYKIFYDLSSWWLLCAIPLLFTSLLFSEGKRALLARGLTLALLTAVFFLGFGCFRYQLYDYTRCGYYDGEYTVTGTVVSYVDNGGSVQVLLKDVNVDGKEEVGRLKAYLPSSYTKTVRVADKVVIGGNVRTDTAYFKEYFKASAVNAGLRFVVDDVTFYQEVGRSKDIFLLVRDRVEQVVVSGVDKTAAAVTLGVLIGDDTKIEGALLDNMRMGGIAHIFAVSGLHVGVLYACIVLLFSKTRLRKVYPVLQFITLAVILLFYAGVCGFSSSIVRATILCLVGYCMRKLGGAADNLNILGAAAIIILLCAPCALFEVGFQLSFAACLGIVLFAKRIGYVCDELYKTYQKHHPRKYTEEEERILKNGDTLPPTIGEKVYKAVASVVSGSLAAQLFTAPVQYMAFGYLSCWSFLLNLIFVPLIGAFFGWLLLCVFVACLLPLWCASYLLYIPAMLWNVILLTFEVVDFSAFTLTSMQLSAGSCVCYYGGVIFLTDKWNISKRQKLSLSVVCFAAFFAILALLNV